MDRAQEFDFVWGLLDAGASFLDATVRVQLCVKIGAGDYRDSIVELLQRFSTVDAAIPPRLAPSLWAWVNGFMGSDSETFLHTLASRIRISNAS
ncbi:MAG: hypothetical protein K2Y33_00640, partial [Mycolicibacterium frederiksbergense]|nr:hypothetical protein [Mycolicibacterium frederiksbergense]